MEGFLRKYGWALQLAFVMLVAIMLAVIASEIIAIYLAPYRVPSVDLRREQPKKQLQVAREVASPTVMANTINDRCLFAGCPKEEGPKPCEPPCAENELCNDGVCQPNPDKVEPPQEDPNEGLPVKSSSSVKLNGVLVASNPRYSAAIMKDPSSPISAVVGIGDSVAGLEIKEIYRDRVIVANSGHLEFIRLDDSLQGNPSNTKTIASAAKQPPKPPETKKIPPAVRAKEDKKTKNKQILYEKVGIPPESPNEIRANSPNHISLKADEVRKALSNPAALARDAQIVPHYQNGKPAGVKIVSIKGPLIHLNLRPGDVIKKVNGKIVTSQMSAFQALQALKNARNVTIDVQRGGQTETLNYNISK